MPPPRTWPLLLLAELPEKVLSVTRTAPPKLLMPPPKLLPLLLLLAELFTKVLLVTVRMPPLFSMPPLAVLPEKGYKAFP